MTALPRDSAATGRAVPLWPLALAAGLLPAAAAMAAWVLSTRAGQIPDCQPFIDGCASISRAARQPAALPLFRALVLPAATLQAIVWLVQAWHLGARDGTPCSRAARWIALMGVAAGVALVCYGAFLGTDGEGYRWMRRHGTVAYFGGTFVAFLMLARVQPNTGRATLALLAAVLAIGLINALAGAWLQDPLKDQIENVAEWWCALGLTACFVKLAADWRRTFVSIRLGSMPTRTTPGEP